MSLPGETITAVYDTQYSITSFIYNDAPLLYHLLCTVGMTVQQDAIGVKEHKSAAKG